MAPLTAVAGEPELAKPLREELEARLEKLADRVTSLRTESEEVWKTLETAERSLLEMLDAKDYDCSGFFGDAAMPAGKPVETVSIKLRADRHETEEFYLSVSAFIFFLDVRREICGLDKK